MDTLSKLINIVFGGKQSSESSNNDGIKYIHYSCSHCGRNAFISRNKIHKKGFDENHLRCANCDTDKKHYYLTKLEVVDISDIPIDASPSTHEIVT